MLTRAGRHAGITVYAPLNHVPSVASSSRKGVVSSGKPSRRDASARCWSVMIMMMFGRWPILLLFRWRSTGAKAVKRLRARPVLQQTIYLIDDPVADFLRRDAAKPQRLKLRHRDLAGLCESRMLRVGPQIGTTLSEDLNIFGWQIGLEENLALGHRLERRDDPHDVRPPLDGWLRDDELEEFPCFFRMLAEGRNRMTRAATRSRLARCPCRVWRNVPHELVADVRTHVANRGPPRFHRRDAGLEQRRAAHLGGHIQRRRDLVNMDQVGQELQRFDGGRFVQHTGRAIFVEE